MVIFGWFVIFFCISYNLLWYRVVFLWKRQLSFNTDANFRPSAWQTVRSVKNIYRKLRDIYGQGNRLSESTINRIVEIFQQTGSVEDKIKTLKCWPLKAYKIQITQELKLLDHSKFCVFVNWTKNNQLIFLKNASFLIKHILNLADMLINKTVVFRTIHK